MPAEFWQLAPVAELILWKNEDENMILSGKWGGLLAVVHKTKRYEKRYTHALKLYDGPYPFACVGLNPTTVGTKQTLQGTFSGMQVSVHEDDDGKQYLHVGPPADNEEIPTCKHFSAEKRERIRA